ncbi:uncharacterized protein NECHADRAFT_75312 [Fusarium vanettenii 77-13-4]|uniref:Uncharacterized protein n=1 Tax=Fusarium vanettenii (strain ATCC MYA-4622 / CBS 123669 / FGSC 9596 / NRRL 45880 / 77-13-4) TaxID=660122 RepID=C7YIG3_FUSV7|nr:uncharacterized protein NECHADRAFT_75312 [Fusarium vanettenii 77-13-4]EEU48092.1 hypothetical protein NECHADRAFT_75312 [Fusarium vanettenii 77-13-4]
MEPPAKRRRKGPSPPTLGQNDDEDDELASHPQEITVRRDPDIQFALKRANANHKLQATMAHIIEKYSRDFEGVGDEIDMETGEIVVNNGHLRNMRDEGDVEGLWLDGDGNAEEGEGILLEDLTDEYSDNQDEVVEPRNPEADDNQNSSTREQDPNVTSNPSDMEKESDSIPTPTSNEKEKSTENQDERLPETRGCTDNEPGAPPHGFPPAPFGPGAPHGYGAPPGPFGPWSIMPGFPMNPWGRDDIPPYYNMPPSMPGPWFNGGRYEFPTNDGQTSIWGRKWVKKTKRAGFMKRSSKGHAESSKNTGDDAADEETGGDGGNDKENSGEQQPETQDALANDRIISASDEDDDLIFSGTTSSPPATTRSSIPSKDKEAAEEPTKTKPVEKALEETAGNAIKVPSRDHEQDDGNRRRSGRARKQVEYMGKISWAEAKEWRNSGQSLSVELRRVDRASRQDFQSVDNTDDESLPAQKAAPQSPTKGSQREMDKAVQRQVIPDSQDTATPFNSSAPQPSQPTSQPPTSQPPASQPQASQSQASQPQVSQPQASQPADKQDNLGTLNHDTMPSMVLSDDEAPLVLSRVMVPKPRATPSKPVSQLASVQEEHEDSTDKDSIPKVGHGQGTNDNEAPEAEPMEVTQDEAKDATRPEILAQPLKRKRGRPRKSEVPIETTIMVSLASAPAHLKGKPGRPRQSEYSPEMTPPPPRRKRGRPRKSSTATREVDTEMETDEPQALRQEISAGVDVEMEGMEVAEKPGRMSRELRWLEKKKPKGVSDLEAQGVTSEKRLRSQGSKETLQPNDVNVEESQGLNEEPETIPSSSPPSPARATSLPKAIPAEDAAPPAKSTSSANPLSLPKVDSGVVSPEEPTSPPQVTPAAKTTSQTGVPSSSNAASLLKAASDSKAISRPNAVPSEDTTSSPKAASPPTSNLTLEAVSPRIAQPFSSPRAVSPSPTEAIHPAQDHQPPLSTPQDPTIQPASTPKRNKDRVIHPAGTPSNSSKPHTPRHTAIRTTRAPSSRRSLLSFVSDSESDSDRSRDELARKVRLSSHKKSARPSTHKIWKSTSLTTELHRTPSRKRRNEPPTPVKTPGGTLRTCGAL